MLRYMIKIENYIAEYPTMKTAMDEAKAMIVKGETRPIEILILSAKYIIDRRTLERKGVR